MNKYLKIAAPFVFLISLFFIITIKSIPTGKLWKEYTVLYLPAQADDAIVSQAITAAGIKNAVSLSGQYLPVTFKADSIEIAMFKVNRDLEDYNYYKKRNLYFFDKSQTYRLYYIPSEYKNNIPDCISILSANNIAAQTDSSSEYPFIIPLIAVILIGILAVFSKNRGVFIFSSLISLFYLLSNPFYAAALANILIILCIFFFSNVWRRKGNIAYLLNNYAIPGMVMIAIIATFSISIKSGCLFLVELLSIFALLITYSQVENYLRAKKSFNPVYIKSAKMVSIYAKKSNIVMISSIVASIILLAGFLLTSSPSVNTKFSKVLLPANSPAESLAGAGEKTEELPLLEDYYQWIWNIQTYPYKSLNKVDSENYFVEYPHYTENAGFISESKTLLAYNQNFKENVYSQIDDLSFNAIEKVLKSEGPDFKGNYVSANIYNTSLFTIIMSLICVFVLLFIYFSIIMKKGIKR